MKIAGATIKNSGHWFCSYCNDVKFLPRPASVEEDDAERCLDCKNNSLRWVKHIASRRGRVSALEAESLFREMREAIG
jgi:hypothetical protein